MRKLIFLAMLLLSLAATAQKDQYVAAKSGLSMREKPDPKSTVLVKIPYGTKINITYPDDDIKIVTEGIEGIWGKVTYGGKTGYVVSTYAMSAPPPKAGTQTMKQYMAQVAPLFGGTLLVKSGNLDSFEGMGWQLKKQLYKNGAEWHENTGYEYHSTTYFLPNLSIAQGFLLLRMIPEFSNVFTANDEFPSVTKKIKKGEIEYDINVEYETMGDNKWVKHMKIEFEEGAMYTLEMYTLDNHLVISFAAGL